MIGALSRERFDAGTFCFQNPLPTFIVLINCNGLFWILSGGGRCPVFSNPNRHDQNNYLGTEVVWAKIKTNFVCKNLSAAGHAAIEQFLKQNAAFSGFIGTDARRFP